jgi:hypothetical protein
MLMPFGKYKDQELSAIPGEYLLWLIANIPLREPLLSATAEELTARDLEFTLPPPPPKPVYKAAREDDTGGAWTMGGDPQELIQGDFPISSRQRNRD